LAFSFTRRRKLLFGAGFSAGFPNLPLLPPSPDSRRRFAMARQGGAARTEARKFIGMFFHGDFRPAGYSFCILHSQFRVHFPDPA
jgi:hypothetical protein